ncbi:phosphoadenylyl-sulfate reductase [Minwuia thermotolerans]|jgi:phosphoadenosine phosphosulfate reductase|uniref:Adenosine 5'-phosphosulfate reductase n=1 Tax=Minwuia thermotolerans TaxID=2056226 RepID=A0A2M9FZK5_9PROT|nr:phosphoadenylyl-sulfate reductase [Minwuia thermotolerans]ANK82697.1 MAG: phosphoadenosine phosphosulfate reductase [Rhizobiales bacterium NRL2]PJK28896.1 phosphoadenylyl-sulfate reductase [Minwuia thermotolerans]
MSFQSRFPFADTERLIRASNQAWELDRAFGHLQGRDLIEVAFDRYGPKLTLVSSFGAEAAVLLHLASEVSRHIAVTFIDTGRLFGETLRYRDALADRLGLSDVRTIKPEPRAVKSADPDLLLFSRDANLCCYVRKVEPLKRALQPFDAWLSGRKRFQGGERHHLPAIEAADGRVKFNPLAKWTPDDIEAHFVKYGLPRHPLVADGFLSIGCMPCTDRVAPGEDARAGRWRGQDKTECGIHTL